MTIHRIVPVLALMAAACTADAHASNATPSIDSPVKTVAFAAPDFATVADHVSPAVVSITVGMRAKTSRGDVPTPDDPQGFFRFFFQGGPEGFSMPAPRMVPEQGLGSGFVIDKTGLIITNDHVVENADDIQVTIGNPEGKHQTLKAKVLGTAPAYDVALIKTERPLDVAPLTFGDSDRLRVGEWVMAVGNPFGLSGSVSVGIVSAKHRQEIAPSGRQGVYDFIQTDASINPGNSGGPVVNMAGEVVGMSTAINAQGAGIGFAIPSNMIVRMLSDLKTKGHVGRSWIGVKIQELTPELASSYGLKEAKGALVSEVMPESPAAKAGLEEGDVITDFDGKAIDTSSELPLLASTTETGKSVALGVWRHDKAMTLELQLGEFPEDGAPLAANADEHDKLGLSVGAVPAPVMERLGLKGERGAFVRGVEQGSVAARAGLREGDVVLMAQGEKIKGPAELVRILDRVKSGDLLRLQVVRDGGKLFLAVRLP